MREYVTGTRMSYGGLCQANEAEGQTNESGRRP